MDNLITIQQAADITHMPENILIDLCNRGTIKANIFNGEILVSEQDVIVNADIEQQPDYKHVSHLAGQGISISAAAKKYQVPQQTISRWVHRGWIKIIQVVGRKTMIDESHIAYYSTAYIAKGGGQGKWVFGKTGKLYEKHSKRKTG